MKILVKRMRGTVVALLATVISVSCGDTGSSETTSTTGATKSAFSISSKSEGSMTPDLRAAYFAAVQADADATYYAEQEVSGLARFVHDSQAFEATLDGAELRLTPHHALWELSLATSGVGCEGEPAGVAGASAVELAGNRVEVFRGDVREWYVNGPLGLEQGFILERAPSCNKTGIVVTVDVGGSVFAELDDDDGNGRGDAITFMDFDGARVARYTDLFVKDAAGRRLDAWMTATAGSFSLHVDDMGAAYPLQIDPLVVVQQQKLVASDSALSTGFGHSVALSGDTAIVGAYLRAIAGKSNQGAAYVFTRSGSVWTQQQRLVASDGAQSDFFGYSVALSGDTAVVAAYVDDVGTNIDQGSVYVFTRIGNMWTQQQKLTASDGATSDHFGASVALLWNTILVGAHLDDVGANTDQGSAYVFNYDGVVWTQEQQIIASDGAAADRFGWSVALSGDAALVGAYLNDIGSNTNQGSVYVFDRSGAQWTELPQLTASDGALEDYFGCSVALSGDTAIVGACFDDVGAISNQGSAYVFIRNGLVWTEQQRFSSSDGNTSDYFGTSVALSGDTAIVGAESHGPGSAYRFTRSGVVWTEQQTFTSSDGAASDLFGSSVALSGNTILVGAHSNSPAGVFHQGAAYVFELLKTNGDACAANSNCVSGFCVDGVCCNAACDGGSTSDCRACSVASGAAVDGICAPISGTTCNDGNACTQTDTCQAGVCFGANLVVCTASDQCHDVGVCESMTGMCSDPQVINGTTCNDGNACTQTDRCQAGICTGSFPVICTASDQCHDMGTCDSATGMCSNPAKSNGAACNDGNACTQTDTCQIGMCTGANSVVCTASDQCHDAGVCNTITGVCSNPVSVNGTVCSDGNGCTQTDMCQAGICMGANPITCAAPDQCHLAGICNFATGLCSNPAKSNGAACNDGNACTQTDTCQIGVCTGNVPVTCGASDTCHIAGVCDTSTGMCSNPAKADGSVCSDGNVCTQKDTCQAGKCTGANPITCTAMDQCHDVGTCDSATGICSNPVKIDGAACNNGTCNEGNCTMNGMGGAGGTAGMGGAGMGGAGMGGAGMGGAGMGGAGMGGTGMGGTGMGGVSGGENGGAGVTGGGIVDNAASCGCRVIASDNEKSSVAFAGLALMALTIQRRRRMTRG